MKPVDFPTIFDTPEKNVRTVVFGSAYVLAELGEVTMPNGNTYPGIAFRALDNNAFDKFDLGERIEDGEVDSIELVRFLFPFEDGIDNFIQILEDMKSHSDNKKKQAGDEC